MLGRVRLWLGAILVLGLIASGCGDDDDSDAGGDGDTPSENVEGTTSGNGGSEEDAGNGGSGGAGTVTLDGEAMTLDTSLCYLQEQDAAAGGGKILFNAQASGTNAAGDPVSIDVSSYDEDSQFAGDRTELVVGSVDYSSTADIGTIVVDGSTLTADGLTFRNNDDFSEVSGSYEINC